MPIGLLHTSKNEVKAGRAVEATPIVPARGTQRQVDLCRPAWSTEEVPRDSLKSISHLLIPKPHTPALQLFHSTGLTGKLGITWWG